MKSLSFELGLNLADDKTLIQQKYDELLKVKRSEFGIYTNAYLDYRLGQFFLVIVYKDSSD